MSANRRQPGDFRTGIAVPILRSLMLVAALVVVAQIVHFWTEDVRFFYGIIVAGLIAFWLLDGQIRPNKAAERAASRRWFGLDD